MIKTVCVTLAIFFSCSLFAQLRQGIIVYEYRFDLHKGLPEKYWNSIPHFQTKKQQLLFNDSASLYTTLPEDETPDPFEDKSSTKKTITSSGINYNTQTYIKYKEKSLVESRELDGKVFLISQTLRVPQWNLSGETREILGYKCKKATMVEKATPGLGWTTKDNNQSPKPSAVDVVAWYTEEIPVSVGPHDYGQLPGAILMLEVDKGGTIYMATEVKKSLGKSEVKEPKKGRKVSLEEFAEERRRIMGASKKIQDN